MAYEVLLSEDAERDIEDIYRYVARSDSVEKADRLLSALEATCLKLSEFPERGNIPKELLPLGMTAFREAHYKPYRAIYRIVGRKVAVYCVVDGRRDMQTLLQRRLVR
ncbi:MAG: type II toxin-antitoxin system RelE/ParE family toxin [Alphaproteobacteria bacterium]|nr:type II toxin-antitoxin system RelE/ParE family toxin [Alphaproteobacteria bacterium]